VPKIMQPDYAEPCGLDDALERAAEVPRLHRVAVCGREDQSLSAPLVEAPAQDAPLLLFNENLTGNAQQRQLTGTGRCLDRTEVKLPADTNELAPNPDRTLAEVHVMPAKAEHLAAPALVLSARR
jgi:hypothetical protein